MKFSIITLFPELVESCFSHSILKRARDACLLEVSLYNPRDFSTNKHKNVDDVPYGGGGGMLIACQPLFDTIEHIYRQAGGKVYTVYMSPRGERFSQEMSEHLCQKYDHILFICGHYEGIDQRVIDTFVDNEISLGDFVLTGGELPAVCVIDAIVRHIPGVLGNGDSAKEESFSAELQRKKEYPHYTRPSEFRGMKVPEVLLNGNHAEIQRWREAKLQ